MRELESTIRDFGLELDVVSLAAGSATIGGTIEEVETRGKGAFFVIQVNRANGEVVARPPSDLRLNVGDGLVVVGRNGGPINAVFSAPDEHTLASNTVS
jgi:voltage-gated potassium channel